MTHQLAFQFKGDSPVDVELMVTVEEKMKDQIGNLGEVEGHDMGSAEINIYVITEYPITAFFQ